MKKIIDTSELGIFANNRFSKAFRSAFSALLRLDEANSLYDEALKLKKSLPSALIELLSPQVYIRGESLEEIISEKKPMLIVSNCSSGALDVMLTISKIESCGQKVKVFLPEIFGEIPELKEYILPVYNSEEPVSKRIATTKAAIDFLRDGGVVVIFGTKEMVSYSTITSYSWNENVAKLAKLAGVDVLPIFISSGNSFKYRTLRHLIRKGAELFIFREFLAKRNKEVQMLITRPLPASIIKSIHSDSEIIKLICAKIQIAQAVEFQRGDYENFTNPRNVQLPYTIIDSKSHTLLATKGDYSAYYTIDRTGIATIFALHKGQKGRVAQVNVHSCGALIRNGKYDEIYLFRYFEFGRKFTPILEKSIAANNVIFNCKPYELAIIRDLMIEAQLNYLNTHSEAEFLMKGIDIKTTNSRVALSLIVALLRKFYIRSEYKSLITPRNPLKLVHKPLFSTSYDSLISRRDILSLLIRDADSKASIIPPQIKRYVQQGGEVVRLGRSFDSGKEQIRALIMIKRRKE